MIRTFKQWECEIEIEIRESAQFIAKIRNLCAFRGQIRRSADYSHSSLRDEAATETHWKLTS